MKNYRILSLMNINNYTTIINNEFHNIQMRWIKKIELVF